MMHGGWNRGSHAMYGRSGSFDDDESGQFYDHQVVSRLLTYVKPFKWRLVLTLGAMLLYTGGVVLSPWIVRIAIDDYIGVGNMSGLNIIVPIFLAAALLQFVTQYVQLRLMAFVGQRVLYKLRMDMFAHLQRLSMSFYDRNEVGRVMSRVQNDVQQLQEFLSIVLITLGDLLSIFGIVVAMVLMDFNLALITLSVIPLLVVMLAFWQGYARRSFMQVRKTIAVVNSNLQENISGVRVVQSLNREQANIRSFNRANSEHLGANLQASRFNAALFPGVELMSALAIALVVLFGGTMVMDGRFEIGILVAFVMYILRFFEPVLNLTMQYGSFQRAMVSGSRIFEIMDVEPEIVDSTHPIHLDRINGEVSFEEVGFYYKKDEQILDDINLQISSGEMVALVGPTGAGKTTIISLLMRLYDVTEGRIVIGGHDIRDVSLSSLSRQMSIVPQEPYLFSGSIKENIQFNRSRVDIEEIVESAKLVGAHKFISKFKDGYDTVLQERGANLSVGQRQLLSFARALVADPRILLLDEATANIDTHTEILIQEALSEVLKDRTSIVIAHRLSTIRNADRIVVVNGGRIVEEGDHDHLIGSGGLYHDLYSHSAKENPDGNGTKDRSSGISKTP